MGWSEVSYSDAYPTQQAAPAVDAKDTDAIFYHIRATGLDLEITPQRNGSTMTLTGHVFSRNGQGVGSVITVELLDQLGVVATETSAEGGFRFAGLTCGIYHIRITGNDWKMGIFGLTA